MIWGTKMSEENMRKLRGEKLQENEKILKKCSYLAHPGERGLLLSESNKLKQDNGQ